MKKLRLFEKSKTEMRVTILIVRRQFIFYKKIIISHCFKNIYLFKCDNTCSNTSNSKFNINDLCSLQHATCSY